MKSLLTAEDLKEQVILKKKGSFSFDSLFLNYLKGDVFILVLNKPANTFSTDFIRKINAKLDEVEKTPEGNCLVTVSTDPKSFSTGLELP